MFCSLLYTCIFIYSFFYRTRVRHVDFYEFRNALTNPWGYIYISVIVVASYGIPGSVCYASRIEREKKIIKEKYSRYIIHFILLCIASKHKLLLLLSCLYMIKKWFRRFSRYNIYLSPNLRLVQPPKFSSAESFNRYVINYNLK